MRTRTALGGLLVALLGSAASTAIAAPALRVQVTQRGDFVLFGNTLAQDCGAGVPAPIVGTIGACGSNTPDTAPDIFWRADSPMAGQAEASTAIGVAQARSTANLVLPAGASVTHAYLYWAARSTGALPDLNVMLDRPAPFPSAFSANIAAIDSATVSLGGTFYQATADVTALVQANGAGPYRLSNVDTVALAGINDATVAAGWWIVVIYENAAEPPRNIALFDGLDTVLDGQSAMATLSGFVVPNAGFNAKLGVVAYDGDDSSTGDSLLWNGTALADALNPPTNFFNSTRSRLGSAVTTAGDLPQLTGGVRSMSGLDFDILDITANVVPGSTSADIEAASTGDVYILGGFVTSISTLKPDLGTSAKSVVDLNGGNLSPGDELEYTIIVSNTGDDATVNTILTDKLPSQVTFVPGSINITTGANAGMKSDAPADDQAEFDAATGSVVARLGAGADAVQGGSLAIGESTTITFRVVVNPGVGGAIENQATIDAGGQQGAPSEIFPTDGNGGDPGAPPTVVVVDSDGDGLSNDEEIIAGTNPFDADSDDDGAIDGVEPLWNIDTDGDGLINALDPDSDDDGLLDGTELGLDCSNADTNAAAGTCRPDADMGATTTDPLDRDTDNGGVSDGSEDGNLNGQIDPGETDPLLGADDGTVVDSDGDGLSDILEGTLGSDPNDADSDDDGVLDGEEQNPTIDTDGDGLINVLDADSDNDALFDGTELGKDCSNPATNPQVGSCIPDADAGATTTSPLDPDTDDGGVSDGSEDPNRDGKIDLGETDPNDPSDDMSVIDSDGDGLSDLLEVALGTDPNDADSDDDGVLDGEEPNPGQDTDGDGLITALDPDSDNDGLLDGTELGKDCGNPATNPQADTCKADADMGATTTSPLDPDTDHGGVGDGAEDTNLDGKIDAGETNPNDPSDDMSVADADGDGLSDGLEATLGTDPSDADTDDDGVLDGEEPNFSLDTDGDGLINVLDVDSDNDALFDGTELGKDCSNPATDPAAGTCKADADMGATTTSPIDSDTDDGGVIDGSEDSNLDGQIDMGELDPNNSADDVMVVDMDGDGLSDGLEGTLGSNPADADSDDDGVIDGQEPNPSVDTDGDGKKNVVDADSDNDGLFDGTELGKDCSNPATNPAAGTCKPDLDKGVTKTSPLDPDTDHGGISDGKEDTNGNGVIDGGETNPNDPADDKPPCTTDADCGSATSGKVCDTTAQTCVDGCRGANGNGCPSGLECTSTDETIGMCVPGTSSSSSGGGGSGSGGGGAGGSGGGGLGPKDVRIAGGCAGCAIPAEDEAPRGMIAVLGAALAALVRRRRRGSAP